MKGVWLEKKELTFRHDIPEDFPEDEVLVKVLRSGICNTDIELMKGYYPYTGIIGHEFVGEVVDKTSELYSKRVVGEINCCCHQCRFCLEGMKSHCSKRTVMGIINRSGTHAEYLTLPAENLLSVPENVSNSDACFVEPLAATLEIQEQLTFTEKHKVAIIGDGKLGLLIAKTIALTPCQLTVFGRHQEKLDILKYDNLQTRIGVESSDASAFDIVVECTGNEEAFNQAINLLRPRGTLVMKSTHEGNTKINAAAVVVKELTLIGSRCGPFDKALALLEQRKIDLTGLLQKTFPLTEAMDAFEHAQRKGVMKVQLVNE
eukprot:TCONS_00009365-protein